MTDLLTILQGDALDRLQELPDEFVQCCVTSPPYWGLRDYGTAAWEGGDNGCDHLQVNDRRDPKICKQTTSVGTSKLGFHNTCGKCGARRIDAQLGLERTPEEYVTKMVAVFREVRRVLKKDGTCWINLGDSYASAYACDRRSVIGNGSPDGNCSRPNRLSGGLKEKDLVGIPWMLAFALRADGWWLRQDIIWSKPNPMPESVTDRCTKAHEYLFLLTKSARYYFDAEAIKDASSDSYFNDGRWETGPTDENEKNGYELAGARNPKRVHSVFNGGRKTLVNKRSVWTVTTQPFSGSHFATFPPDLIKPCILAGTKAGDTVLDPFAGSGTTGMVALELGRKAVLIELNPDYIKLIEQRCRVTPGLALC